MIYTLIVKPAAQRQIRALDPPMIKRVTRKLQQLQHNPRPPGVRKLRDVSQGYRVRVGAWRILYTIDDQAQVVQVYRVKHRLT